MNDESFWTMSHNKATKTVYHERTIRKYSDAIMQQEVRSKDTGRNMSDTQLSEYGANNILLPPLVGPPQRQSTPVRVSEPMNDAPDTPKTVNAIQPLVKNYVPPQVTQLSSFARSRLTQTEPLIIFN
jgi:hypothetical protein